MPFEKKDEKISAVSGWSSVGEFAEHLIDHLIAPIDALSIAILSGEDERSYYRFYRLLQNVWRPLRAVAQYSGSSRKRVPEIDQRFKDVATKIIAFHKLSQGPTRQALKNEIVSEFDSIYTAQWEILIASQIILPLKPEVDTLSRKDLFGGIVKVHYEDDKEDSADEKDNPA